MNRNYTPIKNVAIFGGADTEEDSKLYKTVYDVAFALGTNHYTVVNGGGPGVMLAATKGAEDASGYTLTVTFDPKNATGFEGRYVQNRPDEEIKTHNYVERIYGLMEQGDCFIIFNGGTGTISEFGLAWCLARLYYGHHKPFILYGDFWQEILDSFHKNMMMRPNDDKVYKVVNNPEGVVKAIHEFDQEMIDADHSHCSICAEAAFMR
jgi:uncharacterized protein (TIGR00725 family)